MIPAWPSDETGPAADFARIIQRTSDLVLVVREGRIVFANPAFCAALGYERAELEGRVASELAHPAERDAVRRRLTAAQPGLANPPVERRLLARDGRLVVIEGLSFAAELNGERAVVMMGRDITARALLEEEQRRREADFRSLLDAMPVAVLVHASERIVYANEAAGTALGWAPAELLGKSIHATTPPEALPAETVELRKRSAAHEPMARREQRLLRADGSVGIFEAAAMPVIFEGEDARLVSFRDVSGGHEAQARLRAIFESSPLAISTWDPAGQPVSWNPAHARIFQWPASREEGPHRLTGEQARLVQVLRQRILDDGGVDEDVEFPGPTPAEPFYLHVMASPLLDPAGKLTGFVGMSEDVTQAVKTAAALRRNEAMAAVGQLVAGVAHEVRNPLFAITATLDALQARFGDGWARADLLLALRVDLDRLGALMRDLLDYGSPAAVKLQRAAAGPVIAEALRSCAALAARGQVALVDDASSSPAFVRLDPARLPQVFQNLIQNAVQHAPPGSTVRVQAGPTSWRGAQALEVSVLDSGRGFPEQDLQRIFEPFFTRRKGGTGLGLSIVQRLVEQHGGEVRAANRPEGGAVLTVVLPTA